MAQSILKWLQADLVIPSIDLSLYICLRTSAQNISSLIWKSANEPTRFISHSQSLKGLGMY